MEEKKTVCMQVEASEQPVVTQLAATRVDYYILPSLTPTVHRLPEYIPTNITGRLLHRGHGCVPTVEPDLLRKKRVRAHASHAASEAYYLDNKPSASPRLRVPLLFGMFLLLLIPRAACRLVDAVDVWSMCVLWSSLVVKQLGVRRKGQARSRKDPLLVRKNLYL